MTTKKKINEFHNQENIVCVNFFFYLYLPRERIRAGAGKGVSKQVSNGVKNLPNKAVENGTKAGTKKHIDDAKDKTKIK